MPKKTEHYGINVYYVVTFHDFGMLRVKIIDKQCLQFVNKWINKWVTIGKYMNSSTYAIPLEFKLVQSTGSEMLNSVVRFADAWIAVRSQTLPGVRAPSTVHRRSRPGRTFMSAIVLGRRWSVDGGIAGIALDGGGRSRWSRFYALWEVIMRRRKGKIIWIQ